MIDTAIRIFANFLNNSWTIIYPLLLDRDYTTNESSLNDWLQANWELLVERKILPVQEYLEIYGEGADLYGSSSRVTDTDKLPNFKVIIKSKDGKEVLDILNDELITFEALNFDRLVGFKDGYYVLEPVFNYVLLNDPALGLERVVELENVKFELERMI